VKEEKNPSKKGIEAWTPSLKPHWVQLLKQRPGPDGGDVAINASGTLEEAGV